VACTAAFERRVLTAPPNVLELTSAYGSRGASGGDFLVVLYGSREGLTWRRFLPDGSVATRDDGAGNRVPELPVVLVEDNPNRRLFHPAIHYLDSAASQAAQGVDRFQWVWSRPSTNNRRDNLARGALLLGNAPDLRAETLVEGRTTDDRFERTRVVASRNASLTAYLSRQSQASSARGAFSAFDVAREGEGQPPLVVDFSAAGDTATAVTAVAVDPIFLVAWAAARPGAGTAVQAQLFDETGAALSEVILLQDGLNSSVATVRAMEAQHDAGNVILFWTIRTTAGDELRRLVLSAQEINAIRSGSPLNARSETLALSGGPASEIRSAVRPGEVGLAALSTDGAQQNIWLYRYNFGGQPVARPVLLGRGTLGVSAQYSLMPTPGGYSIIWREDGGSAPDTIYYRSFTCRDR
jgi:hypothetical protein